MMIQRTSYARSKIHIQVFTARPMGCGLVVMCTSTIVYVSCVHPYMYHGNILYYATCTCVSLYLSRPSVPWESAHPSPSHVPHVHVCILMSIPSQRSMGEWDTSQSVPCPMSHVPHVCVSLCTFRPSVPWESGTHPSLSHITTCMCVYPYVHPMGEWDISQSVPYTTCTCVSLCPYHGRVGYIRLSHIPHVRVYPYSSQRTMGEWDTSQSIPCTTCTCVYPYVHPVPAYHGRVGHIPVCPTYHLCVCILMSIPWESGI